MFVSASCVADQWQRKMFGSKVGVKVLKSRLYAWLISIHDQNDSALYIMHAATDARYKGGITNWNLINNIQNNIIITRHFPQSNSGATIRSRHLPAAWCHAHQASDLPPSLAAYNPLFADPCWVEHMVTCQRRTEVIITRTWHINHYRRPSTMKCAKQMKSGQCSIVSVKSRTISMFSMWVIHWKLKWVMATDWEIADR